MTKPPGLLETNAGINDLRGHEGRPSARCAVSEIETAGLCDVSLWRLVSSRSCHHFAMLLAFVSKNHDGGDDCDEEKTRATKNGS